MATISRKFVVYGECPVDKNVVPIEVEYNSFPFPDEDKRHKRFIKNSNQCYYLFEGKCNLKEECPIYKEAPEDRYEDFSKVFY